MADYAIGFDFGSLSVRALIVDMHTGREMGTAVHEYDHGIPECIPATGKPFPKGLIAQIPADYWEGMGICSRKAIRESGVDPRDIQGVGICSTASTVLPVLKDGTPLCELPEFMDNPHAYLKMWKHRGAMEIADRMADIARQRNEKWFREYGSVITCEWMMPKLVELAEKAPEIYGAMDHFIEIADWTVFRLTGTPVRSIPVARCNCFLREDGERPSEDYLSAVNPKAVRAVSEKLSGIYLSTGGAGGRLTPEGAAHLGLEPGTPVSPSITDAQSTALASGAKKSGDMAMIVGTSAVQILLSDKPVHVQGMHISAQDAAVPGLYSLGGGQACVGDGFDWFVKNCIPSRVERDAQAAGRGIHQYLMEKAACLAPGESGIIALDWWNGLRTPLFQFDLTGCILGLTLRTRPEEIYRAMLEASVFGAKRVMDCFTDAGCAVNRIFAGGGIAWKNPLMMQIYADALGREIHVCESRQTGALGSAMLGAMAAGMDKESVLDTMASPAGQVYIPNPENTLAYARLYDDYRRLADYMARPDSPMPRKVR